ncbi:MAG: hypothetical protein A4S12_08285 [Proteobacteria bacterium SG_bin5]|nr:MAG: hypothetical protein A4S12_08285 [Proteobacteria bacterium SG_bin5]
MKATQSEFLLISLLFKSLKRIRKVSSLPYRNLGIVVGWRLDYHFVNTSKGSLTVSVSVHLKIPKSPFD